MSSFALWVIACIGVAVTSYMAVRDVRRAKNEKYGLFDNCAGEIEDAEVEIDQAGFPLLVGRQNGRTLRAELIPDTMTIRRLPQLWLSVSAMSHSPGRASFAILNRPSGNDYYSLTNRLPDQLEPPKGLPIEVLIRGDGARAQALLDRLAPVLVEIFSEARVKEVAVTERGVRIIVQNAEGRRGNYLLLRQATFDDGQVRPELLRELLARVEMLEGHEVRPQREKDCQTETEPALVQRAASHRGAQPVPAM
ncbi:MAG: hypothetical protein ACK5KM_15480 [Hyphomicrobiaceae bacterium]